MNAQSSAEKLSLIPFPNHISVSPGIFTIDASVSINVAENKSLPDAEVFNNYLSDIFGLRLKIKVQSARLKQINISVSPDMAGDAYLLVVDSTGIKITGGNNGGVFYALQTLIELIPPAKTKDIKIQYVDIDDAPRFSYRGMHLDVARHFYNVAEVKKYIDHLALYKMNYFHWHLTDDQGWRIEIKKYPKLQEISAWRKGTLIGHLGDKPAQYDTLRYGGYYSQEEIKDVVNYAALRHVTIIPEIEMPGHAQAVLAAYPELSCTGGPFEVGRTWGVYKDVFCTKDVTFEFLENVLDEVCQLFPGKYIHIGGDECPKDRWKACSECQKLIKKFGLIDENGLQGYFTDKIAAYLKSKNKIAIGWDEILVPGLDSDAVIMSWRGYKGGTDAAINGHDVVMAPASHVYFDMYQSRNTGGRVAIGGYLPLEQVYRFEPVPDVLNADQAKHILGAQGNVWTEYINNEEQLEEMIFPRMCALSEVLWSAPQVKDYNSFSFRLLLHFKLLNLLNLKYSTAIFDISSRVFPNGNNGIFIELLTHYPRGKIYYTLNGLAPTLASDVYSQRIGVDQTVGIQAVLYEGVQQRGNIFSQRYNVSLSTGKEIVLVNKPHEEYSRGGGFSLVDGVTGNLPWIPSEWLGFSGTDLDATIDLEKVQTVSRINLDVLKDEEGRIFLPREVKVSLSVNGKDFKEAGTLDSLQIEKMNRKLMIQFPQSQARWVKVVAKNANGKNWLFIDEISVE